MVARNPSEVEKAVNAALGQMPELRDLGASVVPGTVHEEHGYWYVPVGTAREPSRKYEYFERLSEVEENLKDQQGLDVLIAPSGVRVGHQS